MKRILIVWELGLNLGHLARLLPVATALKERGHAVVVAAREPGAASFVLSRAGISFVQAPHFAAGSPLAHRPAGYADILRAYGWGEPGMLHGLVECWRNLYRLFRPDVVVADYSPTAVLTAHMMGVPYLLIGNGFEIPPATAPLPPFPGFSWATAEQAAQSESLVVETANRVVQEFRGRRIEALRDLVNPDDALLATFAELDHYGARDGGQYVGPLGGSLGGPRVDFPSGPGKKIFACLRPDTAHRDAILAAFKALEASVLCVAPGFGAAQLQPYESDHIRFVPHPVDLGPVVAEADLCVSYGAEGTMLSFLLGGVPQVISPLQVEAYLAARGIQGLGAGVTLRESQTPDAILRELQAALSSESLRTQAKLFASRHSEFRAEDAVTRVAERIEKRAPTVLQGLRQHVV